MKRVRFGLFAVLAGALAVSLSAQTPPPSADQPSSARASRDDKVTVTGCLERAKESPSPTGTSGTASAGASAKFVLNNVTSTPSAAGTAGTSGAATASSYRLDGDDAKLTPHLNHKVEITGTVAKQASATGSSQAASAPRLKVESVKMVSDSCTP